jgi:uncharacterized protein YndB with AHSA1/START domain
MTTMTANTVKKSVTVKAGIDHAFRVFTEGFDSWWPRSHHIGKSPMTRGVIEGRTNGRCYSEQEDGTECDWGTVLVWDPPKRLVLAWQITHQWGYEPDLDKSSEVEIRFTSIDGGTRIDLEHRHFERHGDGAQSMREAVSSPGGWGTLLDLYAAAADQTT